MKRREMLRGLLVAPPAAAVATLPHRPAPPEPEVPPWRPVPTTVPLNEWGWSHDLKSWGSVSSAQWQAAVKLCLSGMVVEGTTIAFAERLCPIPTLLMHRALCEWSDASCFGGDDVMALYMPVPTFRETDHLIRVAEEWRVVPAILGLYFDLSIPGQRWDEPHGIDNGCFWLGDYVGGGLR